MHFCHYPHTTALKKIHIGNLINFVFFSLLKIFRFRTKEMSKNDPDQVFASENEPTPSSSTIARNPVLNNKDASEEKEDKQALV